MESKASGKTFFLFAFAAAFAAADASGAAAGRDAFFRPDIGFEDGAETFPGPARGCAGGGWVVFKPEGRPDWHGKDGFHSSLWELSRFSGGREQGGKRPPEDRVGGADIPLTDAMKADARRFLSETRENGGSLIVRLGYTWSDSAGCEPDDFEIALGHVRELSSIMAEFPDVVVAVEAGVAGPWAEMHSSDYCRAEYMNRVLETYCDTLPSRVSILVRAPAYVCKMAGKDTAGTLAMLPFEDGRLKRLGMFNDGYLGTWWDYGTWAGDFTRERGCEMLKTFSAHPYGGEMAYVNREWIENNKKLFQREHWNLVKDFYDTHLSYLRNVGDEKHTLTAFLRDEMVFDSAKYRFDAMPSLSEYDGKDMRKFMLDHMGWRFVVRDARVPRVLPRGRKSMVALEVENTGFGRLLLPSRAEMVFRSGGKVFSAPCAKAGFSGIDGGARKRMALSFETPQGVPPGDVELFVRVSAPVKGEKRGGIPLRPVRLANAGTWDEELKANRIGNTKAR